MPLLIPVQELSLGEPVEIHIYSAFLSAVVGHEGDGVAFESLIVAGQNQDSAIESLEVVEELPGTALVSLDVGGQHQDGALLVLTAGEEAVTSPPILALEVLGGASVVIIADVMSEGTAGAGGFDPSDPQGGLEDPPPVSGGGPGPGPGPGPLDPDPIAGGGHIYGVSARLSGSGDDIPISSFVYEEPEVGIGAKLAFECADPVQEIDDDSEILFELGIETDGNMEWSTLMEMGKLAETTVKTGLNDNGPTDMVSARAIDTLSEKWDLAPVNSLVLYDPAQIDIVTEAAQSESDIVDEDGVVIEPEFREVDALDLTQLLNFVYVEQLGYGRVITNIPNYPIPRLDFPLTGSYHQVVMGELAVFEPVYATHELDTIYIIDPQGDLPPGLKVRGLKLKHYPEMVRAKQSGRLVTSVLLSYRDNTITGSSGSVIVDRVDSEIQEVGTFAEDGWQRTLINRFFKDFLDDPDNPDNVTRTIMWKFESRVSARVDSLVREILRETQIDTYVNDWNLKTGYTKTVEIYTSLPTGDGLTLFEPKLRTAHTETSVITWKASTTRPGEYVKEWETVQVTGVVLEVDSDDDNPFRQSLYDAAKQRNISEDMTVLENEDISSEISRFREIASDQIEVNVQKTDHLVGRPSQNKSFQHTGTIAVRASGRSMTVVRMLIKNPDIPDTQARPPVSLNAGNLPFSIARPLAQRILDRQGATPMRITAQLAGIDLNIRRGSIRNVHDRKGAHYLVFITGQSIKGENLGRPDFRVSQSVSGIVINAEN